MDAVWLLGAAAREAPSDSTSGWPTAAVGLVGVVVGSILAALFSARRERIARREESQREALYELQDAVLELRQALEDYGSASGPSKKRTRILDGATGRLEIKKQRIICETVRSRVDAWESTARPYLLGDQTVTVTDADNAWNLLQSGVGEELRHLA